MNDVEVIFTSANVDVEVDVEVIFTSANVDVEVDVDVEVIFTSAT